MARYIYRIARFFNHHLKYNKSYEVGFKGNDTFKRSAFRLGLVFSGAFSLFKSNLEQEDDSLTKTIKRAIIAHHEEKFDQAEQQLHLALKMAQELLDQQVITSIYCLMADVAMDKGDFKKAENLFRATVQRLINSGKPLNNNGILELYLKLSKLYWVTGKPNFAETGFLFCLDSLQSKINTLEETKQENYIPVVPQRSISCDCNLENKEKQAGEAPRAATGSPKKCELHGNCPVSPVQLLPETKEDISLLWAMSADSYAQFLIDEGRHQEAKPLFQRALQISNVFIGPEHPQTLVVLNSLGSLASIHGDFKSAIHYLNYTAKQAESIHSSDVAAFYGNLGAVYLQMNQWEEAAKACNKALRFLDNGQSETRRHIMECLQKARHE